MKATKENLIECLKKIGWSVKDHGCEYLGIYNHEGKFTYWTIVGDEKITIEDYSGSFDESPRCSFFFKSCFLQWIGSGNTLCLTARGSKKSVFVFFANYDITNH